MKLVDLLGLCNREAEQEVPGQVTYTPKNDTLLRWNDPNDVSIATPSVIEYVTVITEGQGEVFVAITLSHIEDALTRTADANFDVGVYKLTT